jgi:hypothetical protein
VKFILVKKPFPGWIWWGTPIVPDIQEAEAGGSLEFKS